MTKKKKVKLSPFYSSIEKNLKRKLTLLGFYCCQIQYQNMSG